MCVCVYVVLHYHHHYYHHHYRSFLKLNNSTFGSVVDWVLDLRQEIEIPHTLKDIGVEEEKISTLAPMAAVDPSSGTNPIALTEKNCTELFERCINGKL